MYLYFYRLDKFYVYYKTFFFSFSDYLTKYTSKMPISDFRKKKLLYVFNVFFGKFNFYAVFCTDNEWKRSQS